jgi:hypothetical protein
MDVLLPVGYPPGSDRVAFMIKHIADAVTTTAKQIYQSLTLMALIVMGMIMNVEIAAAIYNDIFKV